MMGNSTAGQSYAQGHKSPVSDYLLPVSLALMLFTVSSFALTYAETISVDIDGTSFDVQYDVTGMTISKIEADTSFTSLILTVDVTESPGTLDITFDRSFFDSIFDGTDDDFIVIVDGAEPAFSETSAEQIRTLSIELPAGIDEVEIIGSYLASDADQVEPPADVTPDPDPPANVTPDPDPPANVTPDPDPPANVTPDPDPPANVTPDPDPPAPVPDTPTNVVPVPDTPKDVTPDPDTDVPDALSPCGPGTVLQGDTCVLDETCGIGTVLKDGKCVVDSSIPASPPVSSAELGRDLVTGLAVAFVGAGVIGIILGLISKASKSS